MAKEGMLAPGHPTTSATSATVMVTKITVLSVIYSHALPNNNLFSKIIDIIIKVKTTVMS